MYEYYYKWNKCQNLSGGYNLGPIKLKTNILKTMLMSSFTKNDSVFKESLGIYLYG